MDEINATISKPNNKNYGQLNENLRKAMWDRQYEEEQKKKQGIEIYKPGTLVLYQGKRIPMKLARLLGGRSLKKWMGK